MNLSPPSKIRKPKLSSMPLAVVLMGLTVLFMLAGVLPVRGGGQGALFRSPVFISILALLTCSTVACSLRRKWTLRTLGFHLTHLSAVLILLGAFVGALFEKKFDVRLEMNRGAPLQRIQLEDGSVVDLGFQLGLKAFRVEKYPPNVMVIKGGLMVAEQRLLPGSQVRVDTDVLTVSNVTPNAHVKGVKLDGVPELIVGPMEEPWARVLIDGSQPDEVKLPDGSVLYIARAYNSLPSMQTGHSFRETDYPVRPGLILHLMASNQMAILSLAAGEPAMLLSPADRAMAPEIPQLQYQYPAVLDLEVSEVAMQGGAFVVELVNESGERRFLIENGGRMAMCPIGEGAELALGPAIDKRYEADLVITRAGESVDKMLAINAPVDEGGWRIYLTSYDRQAHEYIAITLRKDPGDRLVVAGIWGLMLGTALIFFIRRRARQ